MIIGEISAGLGNAMFQYAFARSLALKLDQDLYFYITTNAQPVFRFDKFNVKIPPAHEEDINRLRKKVIKNNIIRGVFKRLKVPIHYNTKYHFDNHRIDNTSLEKLEKIEDLYISGYYGDQKYFIENENIIRKEFTLKEPLNEENKRMRAEIFNSNSVSIHIRRGDYVGNNFFADIKPKHYENAVNYISERTDQDIICYIFSDDIEWARKNLNLNVKTVFVDINTAETDYMELMLMAACKHNIIANSTYSWWGAWLNNNPNKIVIAPKVWYNNPKAQRYYAKGALVPNDWIKI